MISDVNCCGGAAASGVSSATPRETGGRNGLSAAKREIEIYFRPEEFCDYQPTITPWLRANDE